MVFPKKILTICFFPVLVLSEEVKKQACHSLQGAGDIVRCATENHPEIVMSKLRINSAKYLEDKAAQIPNPALSGSYSQGDNSSGIEASLGFTVELGGKRGARKERAKAQKNEAEASRDETRARVKITTIVKLHRYRQLLDEKALLIKTQQAFNKVIGRLKGLPRLSAEQEASLTLFEISYDEVKVRSSQVYEEEKKLERYFKLATGLSLANIRNFLPNAPLRWPDIANDVRSNESPELIRAKSLVEIAEKELSIQKSNGWPDLKIGPTLSIEKEGGVENKMLGLNVEFPLPLFQLNGGAKAVARSELVRSQKRVNYQRHEENYIRSEKIRIYRDTLKVLSMVMGQKMVDKKHERIEKLYLRGIISSSLFLDSLNQKMEYLKNRNSRELVAIQTLWDLYKLDGRVFAEEI